MISLQRIRQRITEDPRLARIVHGSASGLLGKLFALAVSAVTLPLTVRYLGKLEYGIWVTISNSVVMLAVLDLGVANTLTTFIAQAHAEDDKAKAQSYFATAVWVSFGIALLLAPLSYLGWHLINWGSLLHLSDPVLISQAKFCVAAAVGFLLLSLPMNLANRVLSGYQEVHIANYFAMANSVLGLLAVIVTIAMKGTIVHLTLAYSIGMLIGSLALNIWLMVWKRPWIRPWPTKVRPAIVRAMFGQGSLFFVLQLTSLVVYNSDNLVITHYLSAAEVTPYSIAYKLTSYATLAQSMMVLSLWPAFTEAYHKRQLDWVQNTYHSINRKTLGAVAALAVFLGIIGRPLIHFWAGPSAVPGVALLWLMVFYAILVAATTNQALLLTATGRLRLEATVAVLAAITNLGLSIYLVKIIGPEGVILSTILSFLVLMLLPQQWEVKRVLTGRFMQPARELDAVPGDASIASEVLP